MLLVRTVPSSYGVGRRIWGLKIRIDELDKPDSWASFQFILSDDSTVVKIKMTCG